MKMINIRHLLEGVCPEIEVISENNLTERATAFDRQNSARFI